MTECKIIAQVNPKPPNLIDLNQCLKQIGTKSEDWIALDDSIMLQLLQVLLWKG